MTDYRYLVCPICGIHYAVEEAVMAYKDRTQNVKERGWQCPNGHDLQYTENAMEKLRQERDRLKQREAMLLDEKAAEGRRADLAEARERRLKKRASAGVCPCCNKTVSQMAAHMKTKHPGFIKQQNPNVVPIKVRA